MEYVIEMLNITKIFPGVVANDRVTLASKTSRNTCTVRRKWGWKIDFDVGFIWLVSTRRRCYKDS
jgi:hypothetical protein